MPISQIKLHHDLISHLIGHLYKNYFLRPYQIILLLLFRFKRIFILLLKKKCYSHYLMYWLCLCFCKVYRFFLFGYHAGQWPVCSKPMYAPCFSFLYTDRTVHQNLP